MTSVPELNFPFYRTGYPLDPPAEYSRLREEAPATKVRMWNGRDVWIFTKFDDVRALLMNPHLSADWTTPGYPFLTPARAATVASYKTFIVMDPPQHGHFRRMLTRDFTLKRMEELRPQIEGYFDRLIDDMLAHGSPADFHEHVALKLPVTVVSMLIGVPYEDQDDLVRWSADRLDLRKDPAEVDKSSKAMFNYFDRLIAAKEVDPGDGSDMLGRLVIEQIRPGHLNRVDALNMIMLLYFAGHDTTANQIGLGTLGFLIHPDQRELLVSDPARVVLAVEECLRYHTPVHFNACRVATRDIEIGGVTIRAGEGVYPLLVAANRDPAMFKDPDRFDILRENADKQMTFSFGIHQCLGQPLARLELRIVFSRLFQRIPTLRLAVPFEELSFKPEMYVYGLNALPVAW